MVTLKNRWFEFFLLQVSVRELNNIMLSPQEEGGIKYEIDTDNNIFISDSMLHNIIPTQIKKMTAQYKVVCGCECYISEKLCIHFYYHGMIIIKKN